MLHKSHERLSLSESCSLKGNFDVCNWRWLNLKEGPTGVWVPGDMWWVGKGGGGGGGGSGTSDDGCFPEC